jgi:hypothetical protein
MNYLCSTCSGRDFLLSRPLRPGRHTASKNCATNCATKFQPRIKNCVTGMGVVSVAIPGIGLRVRIGL